MIGRAQSEVTCPVIGRAQPELTPSKRQKTVPGLQQSWHWPMCPETLVSAQIKLWQLWDYLDINVGCAYPSAGLQSRQSHNYTNLLPTKVDLNLFKNLNKQEDDNLSTNSVGNCQQFYLLWCNLKYLRVILCRNRCYIRSLVFKLKCFIYPTEVHDVIYNLYVVRFWREGEQRSIAYRAVLTLCWLLISGTHIQRNSAFEVGEKYTATNVAMCIRSLF